MGMVPPLKYYLPIQTSLIQLAIRTKAFSSFFFMAEKTMQCAIA